MSFGQNPTTGTQPALATNQFPVATVAVPNATSGNLTAMQGGPAAAADINGNVLAPLSVYAYDGNDLAQGATTDVAVVGDNAGSISAKLRGLAKIWNDIWDSVNHRVRVDGSGVTQPVSGTFWQTTQPISVASLPLPTGAALENGGHLASIDTHTPAPGQATMASSSPVTIASDQSNVPANIKAVNGTTIAPGSAALPILTSAATGYVAAYGSNPAALTASTDASFKWGAGGSTQVNHVMLQNNSTLNVNFDLDVATSAGSPIVAPGQTLFFDVQTTAVHVQSTGTPNLNGTATGNVVVRGWL